MKWKNKILKVLLISILLTFIVLGCQRSGFDEDEYRDEMSSITAPSSQDVLVAEELFNKATSLIISDLIDNGSDLSDPNHLLLKYTNTDNTIQWNFDFISSNEIPEFESGNYIFDNYTIDGITIDGTLSYLVTYSGSSDFFSKLYTGTFTFSGGINFVIEYNYTLTKNIEYFRCQGYQKTNNLIYNYKANCSLAEVPGTLLSGPNNLDASDGEFTAIVRLTWSPVPGANAYKVYRSLSQDGTYTEIADVASTSHEDQNINKSTKYYYKVTTYNSNVLQKSLVKWNS